MQTILRRRVGPHMRLAFFDEPHHEEGWDAEWAQYRGDDIPALVEYFRGDVVLGDAFARWLAPGGRVLEAGCGFGYWVSILAERGYRAYGLDYSQVALRTGRERLRDVDLLLGNILRMPFPEGAFDGIVSLGVVEHFEEGPDAALRELRRVLRPGGMLLLAVPYVSPARRVVSRSSSKVTRRKDATVITSHATRNSTPSRAIRTPTIAATSTLKKATVGARRLVPT